MNNGRHGQGTHCTKKGADSLAENTPNAPEFICPSSKVWDFNEERFHWAFVVRGHNIQYFQHWPSEKYSSFCEYLCTFKVGTYYLFMQVMTKTYDRTLGSYSGLMVELFKSL